MKLIVNGKEPLSKAIGVLRETYKEEKYFTLTINTGKKRSKLQNALSHAWYLQIANETGEYTAAMVKCLCKYHVGLPIIRGSDEDYNEKCVEFIDTLTYEQKILAMEYMPVTSLMTTKQIDDYLLGVQENYARRDIILDFPE